MITVGDLFSGIGGFSLGLERAGMRTAWFAETDRYASAVLRKHWPDVSNHGDVRSVRAGLVEWVDVICGGFPCQDISVAGAGKGLEGERSGLWSEFARIIGELRPHYAIVENVGALTSRGLDAVLGNLAALGYDAEWHVIPAAAVDAPHLRERVWIIAHDAADAKRDASGWSSKVDPCASGAREGERSQRQRVRPELGAMGGTSPDAARERVQGDRADRIEVAFAPSLARLLGRHGAAGSWPDGSAISPLRRMDDGLPIGMDRHRLRCLGNALLPPIAEVIGRAIIEHDRMRRPA